MPTHCKCKLTYVFRFQGFCDSRKADVKLLRPMRDFSKKEVTFYNVFHKLKVVVGSSLTSICSENTSIQTLTEKFVINLQDGFPATVNTIFRTGDKLGLQEESTDSDSICLLCGSNSTSGSSEYEASGSAVAAEFIKKLSEASSKNDAVSGENLNYSCSSKGNCCGSCSTRHPVSETVTKSELVDLLCYGCRLIVREMVGL